MDELDLLKKQWQSREQDLPRLTYNDIYKMLLKKSSSIVKWIFIISIAELIFWTSLIFLLPDSYKQITNEMGIGDLILYSNIIHYCIFATFIFYFYKNYRSIKVTDNTQQLMRNILKTRKTVKYFVFYNIGMFILLSIIINIIYYTKSDRLYEVMKFGEQGVPKEDFVSVFLISEAIVIVLFVALLMLFYWLVYGLLLRRLNKNYKELKKIEL